MRDYIVQCLSDEAIRIKIAKRARQFALQNYSPRNVAKHLRSQFKRKCSKLGLARVYNACLPLRHYYKFLDVTCREIM